MSEQKTDLQISDLEPIIKKYIEIRRYLEAENAKLKIKLAPFMETKKLLNNTIAAVLLKNKLNSVNAQSGTASTSDHVKYSVVDQNAYIDWLLKHDLWETADVSPIASATDEYVDQKLAEYKEALENGEVTQERKFSDFLPPGVTRRVQCIAKVRAKGANTDG